MIQHLGLADEFLGDAGAFLGTGGTGLDDFVHLAHGVVYLLDALGLLSGGGGDFSHQLVYLPRFCGNFFQAGGNFRAHFCAVTALADRVIDFFGGS